MPFEGKVALVTGANKGIGRAIALDLARHGASVAVNYAHDTGAAEAVLAELQAIGRPAMLAQADVTHKAEVQAMVARVAQTLGGHIDILVNNAGDLYQRSTIAEMPEELWDAVININLKGVFLVTQAVIPYLRDGGRIVNMSSVAAHEGGGQGAAAYAAAKAGALGLTRGLAKELAPRRITVNAIAPGFIPDTHFHPRYTSPEAQQAALRSIPLKRAGTAAEVAALTVFLCSEAAGFITGAVMDINGGVVFH